MGYIVLGLLLVLAGCDNSADDQENAPDPATQVDTPVSDNTVATAETEAEDELAGIEPMVEPVEVTLEAVLLADRRMQVVGRTNLPDGTRVQMVVVREASGVRWQERTVVNGGRVEAGPFGPGSGLPDGHYLLRLRSTPVELQPSDVQRRLGDRGEHLTGRLITQSEHGLGQLVSAVQRVLVGQQVRRTTDRVTVEELSQ
ncbi:hypothetical protein AR456_05705 [Halomonas huangheensis]|nr:hypothetical protein AR456_05705 [Halomonas huangheensis]